MLEAYLLSLPDLQEGKALPCRLTLGPFQEDFWFGGLGVEVHGLLGVHAKNPHPKICTPGFGKFPFGSNHEQAAHLSSVFWWLNLVRLYSLYKLLYPKKRI